MTSQYPKRLIEVDLPIEDLSALRNRKPVSEDVDVKKAGLWWSRKPQHQARAVWLAMLLPDPADPNCPEQIREDLRSILKKHSFISLGAGTSSIDLRADLIRFCRELAEPSKVLNKRTVATLSEIASTLGLSSKVALDPFAGGGSLPVEAQRLGLSSIACDYNPVACLFLRCLMEWGQRVSESELEALIGSISVAIRQVSHDVAPFYPPNPKLGQPMGYIRVRRLQCEGPGCGKIVPATSKFELDAIHHVGLVFEDLSSSELKLKVETRAKSDFPAPTIREGALTCPACGFTTPRKAVTKQWQRLHLEPEVVAVVHSSVEGIIGISDPTGEQVRAIEQAQSELETEEVRQFIPEQAWPRTELRRFSPPLYGYTRFADCHADRQLVLLANLCRALAECARGPHAAIISGVAALVIAQVVDRHSSFCRWRNDRGGSFENTFAGKSLGMIWDFFEADPLHRSQDMVGILAGIRDTVNASKRVLVGEGTVLQSPAQELPLPDESVDFVYTDPPYYDAIPYSHLSDWPFVWMRLVGAFPSQEGPDGLVPKSAEAVVDRPHSQSPSRHDGVYFKAELKKSFDRLYQCLKDDAVGVVVFAHQETTAWESLLEALLESKFYVTASWPILTERGGRLQAQGTASLQSSIHLVVRPRSKNGSSVQVGEWREVLAELPAQIHSWLPRLASEGIVGADAIFACLGPALEIFSKYSRVEKADGTIVRLGEYLEHVWAVVAREALAQVFKDADATGFEADARLTAMWLWTLATPDRASSTSPKAPSREAQQDGKRVPSVSFVLEFDSARKIAQGLGAVLDGLPHLVKITGEQARLLPVFERTRYLFGKDEEEPVRPARKKTAAQLDMFAELAGSENPEVAWQEKTVKRIGETTLDRVHQAMILFAAGRGEALKRFVVDDGVGNDGKFWRLAQALSALYPTGTDERRWVEGVMARKKQFGF